MIFYITLDNESNVKGLHLAPSCDYWFYCSGRPCLQNHRTVSQKISSKIYLEYVVTGHLKPNTKINLIRCLGGMPGEVDSGAALKLQDPESEKTLYMM